MAVLTADMEMAEISTIQGGYPAVRRRSSLIASSLCAAWLSACTSRVCTPGASVSCVGMASCQGYQVCNADGQTLGSCECGSGTSSTGGSSTGSSSTGGSNSGGTTGACAIALDQTEFIPCDGGSMCGAGLRCVADVVFTGMYCEYSCATSADCPDWTTVCTDGNCVIDLCGPGTGNGAYDGICNSAGFNDGTCFPYDPSGDGGNAAYGFCQQAGTISTVGQTCDYHRCPADDLCAPGWGCLVMNSIQPTGFCLQFCDPSSESDTCPSGRMCFAITGSRDYGGCVLLDGGV